MNMYFIKNSFIVLAGILSFNLLSQNDFEAFGESAIALNHKVNDGYKVNFALRSRYYLHQEGDFSFENRQIDFVHFSSLNLDYNHNIALGIQYRIRESIDGGSNELRLTQQFNYTKKNLALRFGHRVRFEQRIFDRLTILRTRYRFATDFPLKGEKLDVGESYLILSLEGLLSKGKAIKPQLDHRTTVQIGWLFTESLKLQLGLEYRFEEFNISTEEKLFILTSLIFKI